MPTEAELIAAIDAGPLEDAPRLAHADWLERNGQPERAVFIRAQLAGQPANSAPWLKGLPSVNDMRWSCWRGYPEKVTFYSEKAFREGWPLTKGHKVRCVEFQGLKSGAKLAAEPKLASVEALELLSLTPDNTLAILTSPHLGRMRHLFVNPFPGPPEYVERLAALPVLAGLRSLHLGVYNSTELPEGPVAALVNSPHLARLRELQIRGWISPEGMRALWRATSLRELVVLGFGGCGTYSSRTRLGGLEDLGDGGALAALEELTFGYSARSLPRVEGKDLGVAVAEATRWKHLRVLLLSEGKVSDEGASALAGASHLTRLERLDLNRCKVSDAGAVALAGSPYLRSLESLDLSNNVIGVAGAAAFARSKKLPRLRSLNLDSNPAPAPLIEAVQARFRDGGPAFEYVPPAPAAPVAAPSAPQVGEADEDGLIRAIWADPYDDVARSVYADWLEEQGMAEHAALLRASPTGRKAALERICSRLNKGRPVTWKPGVSEEGLLRVTITSRLLKSKAFEQDGPGWLRRNHVAELELEGGTSDWGTVLSADWLADMRGLVFRDRRLGNLVPALAASPRLAGLASLHLGSQRDYLHGTTEFFRGTQMRGLCRLTLPWVVLDEDGLGTLADAPFAGHLRNLALGGILRTKGFPVLCSSPSLAGLVTLTLAAARLNDADIRVLVDARGLPALRNLDIAHNFLTDLGLDALADAPLLARLNRLRITVERISQPATERLARAIASTPRCRLVLTGKVADEVRASLGEVLGERLTVE
jgi:uncharacterized protein (TIGR02996 family)